jgi:hypothetical protein
MGVDIVLLKRWIGEYSMKILELFLLTEAINVELANKGGKFAMAKKLRKNMLL